MTTKLTRIAISYGLFEALKILRRDGKYASQQHVLELIAAGKLRVESRLINTCGIAKNIPVRPAFADVLHKVAASTGRAMTRTLDMIATGKLKPLPITPHVAVKANRVIVAAITKLAATRNVTVEQCTADLLNRGEVVDARGINKCPGYAFLFVTQDAYEKLLAEADASGKTVSSVLYKLATRDRPRSAVRLYDYLKPALRRRANKEHKTMSGLLRDILTGRAEPMRETFTSASRCGTTPYVVPPELYDGLVRYAKRCNLAIRRVVELIVTGKTPHLGAVHAPAAEIGTEAPAKVKAEPVTQATGTQSCAPVARCISASELQALVDTAVKKALQDAIVDTAVKKALQDAIKELLAKLAQSGYKYARLYTLVSVTYLCYITIP